MPPSTWDVSGSYYEACNCEAVCPCRRQGDRPGGRATYGVCDFALSWLVQAGQADGLDVSGLAVVVAGRWDQDERPPRWRVALWVDQRGEPAQQAALADIFLGRAGGTPYRNFAHLIGEVYGVYAAAIALEHAPGRQRIRAGDAITVRAGPPVGTADAVTCGIPGHDQPGEELYTALLRVDAPPLRWELHGRCGYASRFAYRSDPA